MNLFEYDKSLSFKRLCGVDEAGRGPLAGDVYAAAVILPPDADISGLNDSKKLSAKKRDALYEAITERAVSYCIASATAEEIDRLNILNATFLAMKRAVDGLSVRPDHVLVDGNRCPPAIEVPCSCLVKGDATSASVAAASILAKVERDRYMIKLAGEYPDYFFEKHKGYGTKDHYMAIMKHGILPVHRRSFLKNLSGTIPANDYLADISAVMETIHYLEARGYAILENQYRCEYGQADLIARKGPVLAFIDVVARKTGPEDTASETGEQEMEAVARYYLRDRDPELVPRFDLAEVVFEEGRKTVRYREDVFQA